MLPFCLAKADRPTWSGPMLGPSTKIVVSPLPGTRLQRFLAWAAKLTTGYTAHSPIDGTSRPHHPRRGWAAGPQAWAGGLNGPRVVIWAEIRGLPRPEPRPRATSAGGKARIYVPDSATAWKRDVRAVVAGEIAAEPELAGAVPIAKRPFGVGVEFRFQRPKKHWTAGRRDGTLRPDAPDRHVSKPDFDNLFKAVLDALGPFEKLPRLLWHDDSQVCEPLAGSRKRYCEPGEEPGALIWILDLNPRLRP